MSTETRAAGRCTCGAVKILITLPAKGCVHCHCPACRHAHGAAFVTWVSVLRSGCQLSGREHLKWYQDTPTSRRGFCVNCGSPLLFIADRWPDDIHVALACIVSEVEISPKFHLSFDQRVAWFPFDDSLPRLGTNMEKMH
ncbi:MAG TPA: GFA family protein [Thermoanaerobaculia bacterium]|jgi:hypothetical protein